MFYIDSLPELASRECLNRALDIQVVLDVGLMGNSMDQICASDIEDALHRVDRPTVIT